MGKKGNHKSLYLVLLALLKIFINVFRYEWLRKLNKILTGLTSSKSCADYQKQQQVRKMKNGNHYLSKYPSGLPRRFVFHKFLCIEIFRLRVCESTRKS